LSTSLALLKQQLAEVLDVERPASPGLPTGIAGLDEGLAGGGIPRGRLTEVLGSVGSGKTTLVRRIVERAAAAGVWVAYVDATRTLAPRDWAEAEARALAEAASGAGMDGARLWVVRPHDPGRAAWCADVLLRSGAFGLVVLDGAPPLSRAIAVRLTRLARESDAALVAVSDGSGGGGGLGAGVGGALRLRVAPPAWSRWRTIGRIGEEGEHRPRERRFVVAVEKGGTHQTVEVSCAIAVARRLCTHSEVPDRRGVERGGRDAGRTARGGDGCAAGAVGAADAAAAAAAGAADRGGRLTA
jgi:recombination protein RecA